MLYIPWRNEDSELINIDVKKKFEQNLELIHINQKKYVYNSDVDYDIITDAIEKESNEMANNVEYLENNDFDIFDLQRPEYNNEIELKDFENNPKSGTFLSPKMLNDNNYADLIRSLNEQQRNFLLGLVYNVKANNNPFYYFLTGGAGTGKSVLINAVFQTLTRWYNRNGQNPDYTKVLLTGPTGKSAFNIRGTTIHTALGIGITENSALRNISADLKNKYRNKLWYLKLMIIDEVSMVGASTLRKIDHQLRQIFDKDLPFAGISILFVGDFNQLRPVLDTYAFQQSSKNDYSILAGTILWHSVKYYRLNEIMRQKNDLIFAKALNNLSTGQLSEQDKALFQSRLSNHFAKDIPPDAIRLFARNKEVDDYNEKIINERTGDIIECTAIDFCCSTLSSRIRDQALYVVGNLPSHRTYNR